MADPNQHGSHGESGMGLNGADNGGYYEDLGNNMHSLANAAHQSSPQQQNVGATQQFPQNMWYLPSDAQQAQQHQLYQQAYAQGAPGYTNDWQFSASYGTHDLQGFVQPYNPNQQLMQHLQQRTPGQPAPQAMMGQTPPPQPSIIQQHSPVAQTAQMMSGPQLQQEQQKQLQQQQQKQKREQMELQKQMKQKQLQLQQEKQKQLEKEKLEQQKQEQQLKEQREREQKEKEERERQEKERQEKERLEMERQEKERQEKERLEQERLEKERVEKERQAKEQQEKKARQEKEKQEKERQDKLRQEAEKQKQETSSIPSASQSQVTAAKSQAPAKEKATPKPKATAKAANATPKPKTAVGNAVPPAAALRLEGPSAESSALSSPLSTVEEPVPVPYRGKKRGPKPKPKPAAGDTPKAPAKTILAPPTPIIRIAPDRAMMRSRIDFRPKTSIPQDITAEDYAKQCSQAAINSRLLPHVLHPSEYRMLREHISHTQVTTYLHIRNGILRLWQRNPLVSVTREEAAGCAKDYKYFEMADVAYAWLVRNGYINFGCIEVPNTLIPSQFESKKRKRIVVVGAGISGLCAARQLEGLYNQLAIEFDPTEGPAEIILLEGRGRIGGRVYSHPLQNQATSVFKDGKRSTADLGAQIITGFDNGNPLSVLVRGQLALSYRSIHDTSRIYDYDGSPADKTRDTLTERLYNDILDRVAVYKKKNAVEKTAEGDKELIDAGRDPVGDGGRVIAKIEENEVVKLPPMPPSPLRKGGSPFSAEVDRRTGKPKSATGSSARIPASYQLQKLGWKLKDSAPANSTIELKPYGKDPKNPTLGQTMDAVLEQYQKLTDISPLDLRLINWHYANLEYANAINVDKLSLGSWDQDDGNEFRGPHAMLIGGYTQVARGLWMSPRKLDVRPNHVVKKVSYPEGGRAKVECENGTVIEADKVVITLPLGVLKAGVVEFDPPLPAWKQGAIDRLGYGLLNKVIMVFNEVFWDAEFDMMGLLREPVGDENKQSSYEQKRGRFYLIWNCTDVAGRPMLVALMAGEAAHQAENEPDEAIISEFMREISKIYPTRTIPQPTETIITRWSKDKFALGSYSYVAAEATGEDYNLLGKPVGDNLFFAGEHTCGTHPASVHGAYISGLRVASDIMDSLLGPIQVPTPFIPQKPKYEGSYTSTAGQKRKAESSAVEKARELKELRMEKYDERMREALLEALGERPTKPFRSGANPFLLYQKDHWFICKAKCDELRRKTTGNPEEKASRNEVRAALGLMWREAPEEQKKPYLNETESNKKNNTQAVSDFKKKVQEWDEEAEKFKKEWMEKNPSIPDEEEAEAIRLAELEAAESKRNRKLNGVDTDVE